MAVAAWLCKHTKPSELCVLVSGMVCELFLNKATEKNV